MPAAEMAVSVAGLGIIPASVVVSGIPAMRISGPVGAISIIRIIPSVVGIAPVTSPSP
jgi:hypothetical protein